MVNIVCSWGGWDGDAEYCGCYQIQLSFIFIRQYHSLWSTDSPTLLIFYSSSSPISLKNFTIFIHPSSLTSLFTLTNLFIINLAHLMQHIINFSNRSNIISRVHLTVTNNSFVTLTVSLTN